MTLGGGKPALFLVAALVLASCASEDATQTASPSPSPSPASPSPSPSPSPASPSPSPSPPVAPTPVIPEQGGAYWGVYVAIAAVDEQEALLEAAEALDAMGISEWSMGDLGCDRGARRALDVPRGSSRVAIYFATQEEAEAFAASLPAPPTGVARVRTYCLD